MADELKHSDDRALQILGDGTGTYTRFVVAALGSIPWLGGLLAAGAALHGERAQAAVNQLLGQWLHEHETRIDELFDGLRAVAERVDSLGEDAKARMQDDSYLVVVRKAFQAWDRAETKEKRNYVLRLLTNAAATRVQDDDIVRLFVDWIDRYHDAHFGIIRAVYQNRGITRLGIWRSMGRPGKLPRENSSDADLFRMLIHDLSTGRVIRQERDFDGVGFLTKTKSRRAKPAGSSRHMKSSFDDTEPYELSELGQDFVHYVLNEAVTRLNGGESDPSD